MNKFKKATKRITVIAASAVLVSSAAFGAGLSNYPGNFVTNGQFTGQVVVGANAQSIDTTSAQSVIDNLKSQFSGETQQVKITYTKAGTSGNKVLIADPSRAVNFGESLGSQRAQKFDSSDLAILADGRFNNNVDDEDYTQEVRFSTNNGYFEHSLRTNANQDTISNHIYIKNNANFFNYTLKFNTAVDFSSVNTSQSALNNAFVGQTLNILGGQYTVTKFSAQNGALNSLELIGGSNKISLGEGQDTTVSVNGKTYDVSVQSVGTNDKVLLTVNGETKSVDLYDTQTIGGISVAVTDAIASSRDSVKGYAELVIGGNKITLTNNAEVKINDKYISDLYPDYYATTTFDSSNSRWKGMTINYQANNDMVLKAGQSFQDKLFNALSVNFAGTNNPTYSTVKLSESGDQVDLSGTTIGNNNFNDAIAVGTNSTNFHLSGSDSSLAGNYMYVNPTDYVNISSNGVRFLTGTVNDQYLWEVKRFDPKTNETDFQNVLTGTSVTNVLSTDWAADLNGGIDGKINSNASSYQTFNVSELQNEFAFQNQELVNLGNVGGAGSYINLSLDKTDVSVDNIGQDNENIQFNLGYDTSNNRVMLMLNTSSAGLAAYPSGGRADLSSSNSDTQEYVTTYGTLIKYDRQNSEWADVSVPDKQVEADVYLVAGASSNQSQSVTVSSNQVAAKKADLQSQGYTIVSTDKVAAQNVVFNIAAPVYDKDVTGTSNMIVVGGPAVNTVAAQLLGMSYPTYGAASGVAKDEAVIKYYSNSNSVLVYGYEGKDTAAAVAKLNAGGLSGDVVNVQ